MSNKAISIYFGVFTILYFGYSIFITGHGIHWTNSVITVSFLALAVYFYLKGQKKIKNK